VTGAAVGGVRFKVVEELAHISDCTEFFLFGIIFTLRESYKFLALSPLLMCGCMEWGDAEQSLRGEEDNVPSLKTPNTLPDPLCRRNEGVRTDRSGQGQ
jgi:hypothetical protein